MEGSSGVDFLEEFPKYNLSGLWILLEEIDVGILFFIA